MQQSPLAPVLSGLQSSLLGALGDCKARAEDAYRTLQGHQRRQQRRLACHGMPRIVVPPRCAAILPGDSVAEQVITNGMINFLNLYNSALVLRLVLTWFPSVPEAISSPLSTVCDPYLNLFRGIIPPLGGTLDLSPILAFVVLNFFTSTAAALPCEMGPDGKPLGLGQRRKQQQGWQQWMQPSRYQQMWARRVEGQRALAASASDVKP